MNNSIDKVGVSYIANNSNQSIFLNLGYYISENTPNGMKTYLTSNNIAVYYVLNTPQYLPITGTLAEQLENVYQKMLSQKGVTNISQINADLPFNMSIQAIEDISNE